ncbi:MAG: hypothetical protein A3D31_18700 [Candidatus Fluviicola riflensis]|nr:MAG: hypothetical protein CHH17_03460 [Candidatus Fluviicola riflensis]OGS76477.1 MAG: hypothetical protein A3D31_18700 [Candidatus Fluviicola riflensis]OGS82771.1 MAG: hypothetical protein A2724_13525 [Fluviicola sp. RIFCSPHIGHO2_01_FULL_43_53]OGS89070.1 MAG: hypothetical protein A3E30_17185 [Fluviicola sp. RIFCSPHIGHO2_12_FULL_43_24]
MKRLIFLVIALILVGVLGYVAYNLSTSAGKSDQQVASLDFEIKDTATIDRIIITEPNGLEMELIRSGNKWTDKSGGCIQQVPVANMLEAAFNVRFKGYVPDNSVKTVLSRLTTLSTKVQFFKNGEWSKTWYIGSSTQDHYGTYMLVESEEKGKSDLPIIAEIKGMQGMIGPRFFADKGRWMCTEIFAYQTHEIASVDVRYTTEPKDNFTVKRKGKNFSVTTNGKPFPSVDTSMVYRYLQNYKMIHFESPNYDLSAKQVDSVKRSKPFCVLTLKSAKGTSSVLKLYRKKSALGDTRFDDTGKEADYDINHFWCVLPNNELVQCQYYVFNPLIMGRVYFNYAQEKPTP